MVKDTQDGQSKMDNEGIKKGLQEESGCVRLAADNWAFFYSVTFFLHAGLCKGQNVTEDPSARLSKM